MKVYRVTRFNFAKEKSVFFPPKDLKREELKNLNHNFLFLVNLLTEFTEIFLGMWSMYKYNVQSYYEIANIIMSVRRYHDHI